MKVEEVLVTKGYLSKEAVRSATLASGRASVPVEIRLLSSGAIGEEKFREALSLSPDEFAEFKDRLLFLKRTSLFSELNERELQEVAASVSWEWFPRGHVIISQGSKAADFYVVHSGRVKVCVSEGERETTLAVLSRGECFGEMSLLSGGATTATVKAAEPTLCLKQGQRQFLETMDRYPTLHRFFSKLFVKRVRTIYKEILLEGYPFLQPSISSAPSEQTALKRPVTVLTLGTFGIIRNGKPVVFSGKAQKKPLLLLKALISLGGRHVRESAVTELLWPDSEGDAAHSAFSTTLSRLRHLLGSPEAVEVREGNARINPDCLWVDVWEFDRLSEQADQRSKGSDLSGMENLQNAIRLYKGSFLPSDDEFWTFPVRENVRNRFVRLVLRLGDILEEKGDLDGAQQVYERALEIDDFVEECHQRLMTCHLKRGCRAEAMAAFERCARMLSTEFGMTPSDKTLAIVAQIKSGME